jgi:hypothetical protein
MPSLQWWYYDQPRGWMGVPTLTFTRRHFAGCQGLDIMYTYGLESFVAFSKAIMSVKQFTGLSILMN